MVDDKEDEDNENSTDDEEFVCANDENDVIILDWTNCIFMFLSLKI